MVAGLKPANMDAVPRGLADISAQTFLDSFPSPAVVVDSSGILVGLNAPAEVLLGKVADKAIGSAASGAFAVFLERARRSGTMHASFEHHYGHAWYSVLAFPVDGSDGEPTQAIVATDVSEAKNAEFAIRESEGRLEEATRIAQLGTYKLFWDTGTAMWSPHMYVLHGLIPDSHTYSSQSYRQLVHPEDRFLYDKILEDQLSGKHVRAAEYRIVRKDGAVRWLRIDGRVLFDADGEPYASFGTCQDVTEGKQREQELKNLLRRNTILYEALDASPIGVAVVTTDGQAPSFFYVNAEFERLTLHNTSSLSEAGLDALRIEEDDAAWNEVLKALSRSEARAFELQCARRDGSSFIAQIEVAPVRDHPGQEADVFVLNLRDITVDRQRAETLLQSQKMEALGQLSGGVAHEINNLLQPILALSELGIDLADKNPEKVRKYFDVISSSGRKARDIVRQILTFARRDIPQLASYPIRPLVDDALNLLQSSLPPGIQLNRGLGAENTDALVNPTQVSQVILNLVKNAADAMDGIGTISVTLQCVDIDEPGAAGFAIPPGRWIELKVMDQGCGMDSYTLSRIFEPFFTTKLTGKGTGLGLSVAYSIVKGWGGTLSVDSEVDIGTTAMVYIPISAQDTSPSTNPGVING